MSSGTKKMLVVALLALALSASAYGGLWYVLGAHEKEVRERAIEQVARVAEERQMATLQKVFDDTADDRAALRTFVVAQDGVSDFLELIEGTARGQGLAPSTRSVQVENVEGGKFEALALDFEVTGAYHNVATFLPLIESLPYQVEVRSVVLERTGDGDGASAQWRGAFKLRIIKEKML